MSKKRIVSELAPGMILAEDVLRPDGQIVLPKGATLTERHLDVLEYSGVREAAVCPAEEPEDPAGAREADVWLEPARDYLLTRFAFCDFSLEPVRALFDLCVPRTASRMRQLQSADLTDCQRVPLPDAPEGDESSPAPDTGALLQADLKLVSLPDVFVRISEVVNNPHSTPEQAAAVISKDPSLAVKLLKIVNSAFFGLPSKVEYLSRAVTIVGGRQLTTLALGVSVLSLFKDLPAGLIDVRSMWKHSISCAVAAASLAEAAGFGDSERYFASGLLHDVGRLVMYKNLPALAARTLRKARRENCLLRDAELALLGWDHALLAGRLLRQWNFPESLIQAVQGHHDPDRAIADKGAAVTHVADVAANAIRIGSSGEFFTPPLRAAAWDVLDIPAWALTLAVERAERDSEEILRAFAPEGETGV